MAVIPFRWQGATRREQVRSATEARSKAWLDQWSAGRGAECCVTLDVSSHGDDADAVAGIGSLWWQVRSATGGLCLRLTATTCEDLGCRLVGLSNIDGCEIAAGIGRRALVDLVMQLAGPGAEIERLTPGAGPLSSAIDSRSGVVSLTWSLDESEIEIHVDAGLCDMIAPKSGTSTELLVAREEAILPGEVTLAAVLDLGHVVLADTIALRPGEIIKTDMPIDAVVEVHSESGRIMLSGVLAAADGHRALRCTTTTHG